MRSILISTLMAAAALPAFAATDDELRAAIVGAWGNTEECNASILTFREDGRFQLRDVSIGVEEPIGNYTITNGRMYGQTGDNVMPEVTLILDGGILYFGNADGSRDRLYPCAGQ